MTEQQRLAERMANLPSYVIKTHDIARGLRMPDEECKSMANIIARARDCILEARAMKVFEKTCPQCGRLNWRTAYIKS